MSLNNYSKKLDIRGKTCPMTFVYTKLALEDLKKGEILKVILDYPPAVENIPENSKRQSLAETLKVKKQKSRSNEWVLLLQKK
ncbi:MAG: sulfurtransferase TusA family protein [Promethearchaeia archaeon]